MIPMTHMDKVLSLGVVTVLSVMLYAKMLMVVIQFPLVVHFDRGVFQLIGAMRMVLWPRLLCRDFHSPRLGVASVLSLRVMLEMAAYGMLSMIFAMARDTGCCKFGGEGCVAELYALGHDALIEIVDLDAYCP
ncbi:hypothetical protein Nepgr_017292 [Nepenthes gracilis]|uniref:Uncharacterized protein n=1 Tax=Nepenthes gracilis TaxID=150966 RepID=A0AAD3XT63_NEPGR|nr:hypothetical protein Nepgr_017292 [Nepenthes gracilis]